jgi:hypothetical protein
MLDPTNNTTTTSPVHKEQDTKSNRRRHRRLDRNHRAKKRPRQLKISARTPHGQARRDRFVRTKTTLHEQKMRRMAQQGELHPPVRVLYVEQQGREEHKIGRGRKGEVGEERIGLGRRDENGRSGEKMPAAKHTKGKEIEAGPLVKLVFASENAEDEEEKNDDDTDDGTQHEPPSATFSKALLVRHFAYFRASLRSDFFPESQTLTFNLPHIKPSQFQAIM